MSSSGGSVPILTPGPPGQMLGDAIKHPKSLARDADLRADAFDALATQIENHSNGAWQATRGVGTDGSTIFLGRQGEGVVISTNGKFFAARLARESTSGRKAFAPTSPPWRRSTNEETKMNEIGTLLKCDEAMRFIEQISDPVTKSLVNLAFVHFVKNVHLDQRAPASDVDMLFLVTSLKDFFAEHDVLARTLEGDKVGAWFDDEK